jgi:hypothetical protein
VRALSAIRNAPLRLSTGVFIVGAGVSKLTADDETAKGLREMAKDAYPIVEQVDPVVFARALGVAEVALGTALLLPVVSPALAGAGLSAFSTALLGVYMRAPGMRQEGSVRPTPSGIPLAKDVWMLGIGVSLLLGSLSTRRRKQRSTAKLLGRHPTD